MPWMLFMPTRNLFTIIVALFIGFICYQTAQRQRYATTIASAMALVEERALEPRTRPELFTAAMNGMMGSLDEHSAFIDRTQLPEVEARLDQEFGGVGIVLERNPRTNELRVLTPMRNSPASEAGIRAGDVILSIDGKSVDGLAVPETVEQIRGELGTTVSIELRPDGSTEIRNIDLVRSLIPVESVLGDTRNPDGSWVFALESHPSVGYIRILEFGEKTVDEFDAAISQMPKPLTGLIIDMRGNSGGLLEAAVDLCDRFLESGDIVTIKRRDGELHRAPYVASPGVALDESLPIAILIDSNTASAAEIVAACFQDYDRATIVGERSFGKGTVQQIILIDGGRSALKLTVSSYWRPSGRNIHRPRDGESDEWGVVPNGGFDVALTDDERKLLFLYRRRRDYPSTLLDAATFAAMLDPMGGDPPPETLADPMPTPADGSDPLDDFQDRALQRAIEAIGAAPATAVAVD